MAETDDRWPGVLAEIARAAGDAAAETLQREAGGTHLYLPMRPAEGMQIVALVGQEAADAIVREIGYGLIKIPSGARRRRGEQVAEMLARGMTIAAVARHLGVDASTVFRHRQRQRART